MKPPKIVLTLIYILLLNGLIHSQYQPQSKPTHEYLTIPNQIKYYSFYDDGVNFNFSRNKYSINRIAISQSQIDIVDTAIVLIGTDTMRHIYSNNLLGMITLDLTQQLKSEQWINSNRRAYTYNENHQFLTQLYEIWFNGQWINQSKYNYTYDGSGLLLNKLIAQWINGQWVNSSLSEFSYNSNGLIVRQVIQTWTGGQWVNLSQTIYTYDESGNLTQLVEEQWINGQWVSFFRETMTYDGKSLLITELFEEWLNSQWTNVTQRTYTYDSTGHLLMEFEEGWVFGQWINQFRRTSTYDERGILIEKFSEGWDIGLGQWRNLFLWTYTYNDLGLLSVFFSQEWVMAQWENYFRETWSYNTNGGVISWHFDAWRISQYSVCYFTDSAGNQYSFGGYDVNIMWKIVDPQEAEVYYDKYPKQFSLLQNYPNPFNPSTKIRWQSPAGSHQTIKVFDVLGNEIATLVDEFRNAGNYEVEFNTSTIKHQPSSGVYFYQLKTVDYFVTKKMLYLK